MQHDDMLDVFADDSFRFVEDLDVIPNGGTSSFSPHSSVSCAPLLMPEADRNSNIVNCFLDQ